MLDRLDDFILDIDDGTTCALGTHENNGVELRIN